MKLQIAKEGISYLSAAQQLLAGVEKPTPEQLKDAIKAVTPEINGMVSGGVLRYDRTENGCVWWVKETRESFDAPTNTGSVKCLTCGKHCKEGYGRRFCSGRCKDIYPARIKGKVCGWCGEEVPPRFGGGKYCSDSCRRRANENRPELIVVYSCALCGKTCEQQLKYPSERRIKYCSDSCRAKHLHQMKWT
jgi:endogenous inhibitor of DNA gyrase (YacG/DUF329 family)